MSLSIGLEALNKSHVVEGSFESNYADFMESYTKVQDAAQQGLDLFTALENLSAINKTVKQFGFTKSMESLIGHQLGSTRASVEEETAKVSRNLWEKIVDWFKKMWRYVKDFFAKLFNTRRGLMMKLKAIKGGGYVVKNATKSFDGYTLADLRSISTLLGGSIDKWSSSAASSATVKATTDSVKLTNDQVKDYAGAMLTACQNLDAAEKVLLGVLQKGIKSAENGVNKPNEDIDTARELKNESAELVKKMSASIKKVFVAAKNFVKYVKKG